MPAQLTVLASGSAGNSALVQIDGIRVLIDAGLEPRALASRLESCGIDWQDLSGVLITHRHTDHWRPATLLKLAEHRVPLFAHRDHIAAFRSGCKGFEEIERSKLVRPYMTNRPIALAGSCAATGSWQCRPFRVRHDSGATFGFRFDAAPLPPGSESVEFLSTKNLSAWSFAYVADLGCWDESVVAALRDVDLLAVELNHDPAMLKASTRPPWLIKRVLGDEGHLSNAQAAELLRQLAKLDQSGRLRQLVLLHLSRECNTPELATAAAEAVLAEHSLSASVFVAEQDQPSPTFVVGESLLINQSAENTRLQQLALF